MKVRVSSSAGDKWSHGGLNIIGPGLRSGKPDGRKVVRSALIGMKPNLSGSKTIQRVGQRIMIHRRGAVGVLLPEVQPFRSVAMIGKNVKGSTQRPFPAITPHARRIGAG